MLTSPGSPSTSTMGWSSSAYGTVLSRGVSVSLVRSFGVRGHALGIIK